jgi:transposase-like protein
MNENGVPERKEVSAKPAPPRKFSLQEKLDHLAATDPLTPIQRGAYMRRHNLYSSNLNKWRKLRAEGRLTDKKPGRPRNDEQKAEIAKLKREIQKLEQKLSHADKIIDVQKKLCELFNLPVDPHDKKS